MKVYLKGMNSCTQRRKNLEQYREFLLRNGHTIVKSPAESDVIVVWTCGFREDVAENSLKELERYAKDFGPKVIAVGCLPDIAAGTLKARFKGSVVRWRDEGSLLREFLGGDVGAFEACDSVWSERALCDDIQLYRKQHPDGNVTFHDQFVKLVVCEGCPFKCTYCTERLAFPAFRSFSATALVEACRRSLGQSTNKRVMLIGDCVGEYGKDIGSSLPILIRCMENGIPGVKIALNNLHPVNFLEYYDDMESLLVSGTICHVNIPVQSASDSVLKAMDRQYTRGDIERVFSLFLKLKFREFDTHVIVGFPGEREEDFGQTVEFIVKYRPKYVLVSNYFESPNAASSRLGGNVEEHVATRRASDAQKAFEAVGIICNREGGELGKDRLRRINSHP